MFGTLLWKECKQTAKSITYMLFVICLVLFCFSQLSDFNMPVKPQPGQKDYGHTLSDEKPVIMQKSLLRLLQEYSRNAYASYPVGFYKQVVLSEEEKKKMEDIITEISGSPKDTWIKEWEDGNVISVKGGLSYESFVSLMNRAAELIGNGSSYEEAMLQGNADVPQTYEGAMKEYNSIVEKDHVSNAYARLFCDYLGIVLAILPVFLAVTRGLRDRRAKADEVIGVRKASSFVIIGSRYLSLVIMAILPVLLLSVSTALQCMYFAESQGVPIAYLAFPAHLFGWLMPTILVSLSVGFFLTELTNSAIGIFVMAAWWFFSIFSAGALVGVIGTNLIPRFNTLGEHELFQNNLQAFIQNRIAYAAIAIVLFILTVVVYERKRKGEGWGNGKLLEDRNR